MQNVMVDLETLGTEPGCVVLSIGAVAFDRGTVGEEFYRVVNLESSLKHGMSISAGTLVWWMSQNGPARDVFAAAGDRLLSYELPLSLASFDNWLASLGDTSKIKVWGNGSDFDNAILARAYEIAGLKLPWRFYNNRCFRTLKNLYPGTLPPALDTSLVKHNALDDARAQAKHAAKILDEHQLQ